MRTAPFFVSGTYCVRRITVPSCTDIDNEVIDTIIIAVFERQTITTFTIAIKIVSICQAHPMLLQKALNTIHNRSLSSQICSLIN